MVSGPSFLHMPSVPRAASQVVPSLQASSMSQQTSSGLQSAQSRYVKVWEILLFQLVLVSIFSFELRINQCPKSSRDYCTSLGFSLMRNVAEKSWVSQDINGRFEFLERELQSLINDKVSSCSSNDSVWEINQDNLLLNSHCSLYKSATEEVSIWGWPLQTAGLLTAKFSSRSFTILSGRVTEWSDGKVSYSTGKANNSWVHQKWSASAVQLDPNT
ncbi:hypothetical protein LOK49_LG14G00921 [Camellia lanceoleosa]|uniref:Uncharacterized protein n=1 Tax=Camellia lanceoleosa TaxID=1840588 RepID=A0ACC0FFS9_9ERIC|nr:hypothetical protein LOK49_LG14G00921 [Camellia lanceoleosa]